MDLRGGICCPYGSECPGLSESVYVVTLGELEKIVDFGTGIEEKEALAKILLDNNAELLTHAQITDLRIWLVGRADLNALRLWLDDYTLCGDEVAALTKRCEASLSGFMQVLRQPGAHPRLDSLADEARQHLHQVRQGHQVDTDPYVEATTKKCPSCGMGSTHYHGHNCHHISPFGGCPLCHINYCYRCLASESQNVAERSDPVLCKCGFWSNYCQLIRTPKDIQKFIVPSPVPYDKRCGCVICPDCLYGQPCGTCPGNCVVCLGYLSPGPREILSEYKLEGPGIFPGLDEPFELLQEACRHGDVPACLDALLRRQDTPYDINTADSDGQTVLYFACDAGHSKCVALLLEHAPDIKVDQANRYGYTPLIIACKDGLAALAALLLETGRVQANLQTCNGYTALYVACCNGHLEAVQLLLTHQFNNPIDVNLADGTGHTPLMMASKNGHLAIVLLLLRQQKIDIIKACNYGSTASFWAEANRHEAITEALKAQVTQLRSAFPMGKIKNSCKIS